MLSSTCKRCVVSSLHILHFITLRFTVISLLRAARVTHPSKGGKHKREKILSFADYLLYWIRWIEGKGYTFSDLFLPIKGKLVFPKDSTYECPTTFESILYLNTLTVVIGILALYADIVLPNVTKRVALFERFLIIFLRKESRNARASFILLEFGLLVKDDRPRV